jgi:hypothetical protein
MLPKIFGPVWLYRICTVLFVLFAAGHTVGFLMFVPPTPEAREVYAHMQSVKFGADGRFFTYGAFYEGFGLFVSIYLLLCAYLCWFLSRCAARTTAIPRDLGWTLAILQFVGIILSMRYFSAPPVMFSLGLTILLTTAAVRPRR